MIFWWWLETWGGLANLPLRWWIRNCTPHYIHLLGLRKSENFVFGIAQCLLRATELSQTIFIAILLGAYSSNGIVGTPINYAWLNSPTIIFCFLDIVESHFQCGWKRELFLSVYLLKYYFFRLSSRLLSKSFLDLVYSGMCFFRYIHIQCDNLKKQTNNTTFVNLRGAFIRFILCDVNLSSEVCFDNMALGLLSVDRPDL